MSWENETTANKWHWAKANKKWGITHSTQRNTTYILSNLAPIIATAKDEANWSASQSFGLQDTKASGSTAWELT